MGRQADVSPLGTPADLHRRNAEYIYRRSLATAKEDGPVRRVVDNHFAHYQELLDREQLHTETRQLLDRAIRALFRERGMQNGVTASNGPKSLEKSSPAEQSPDTDQKGN
jgi:hypothetical protein